MNLPVESSAFLATVAPALDPLGRVLPVTLLGGILGLDVVSVPQAMISRPIVGATLAGAVAGHPEAGLACGAALECLALESLPVGASRYPEWGSASVVAGSVAALAASHDALPRPALFVCAVLVGTIASWLGGITMNSHRRRIAAFARPRIPQLASGDRGTVVALHRFGLIADFCRAAVLALLLYVPSVLVAAWVDARWHSDPVMARATVITVVAAVAATAVWKDFHAISGTRRLFLVALAVGTGLVLLRV